MYSDFPYTDEDIKQRILKKDESFYQKLSEYLKSVAGYYVTKETSYLHSSDFEEIAENVLLDTIKGYSSLDEKKTPYFKGFLAVVFRRQTINYLSKKTGIGRNYYHTVKQLKLYSEKYNIPIIPENYYKFHRLLGCSIQQIRTSLEVYTRVYSLKASC